MTFQIIDDVCFIAGPIRDAVYLRELKPSRIHKNYSRLQITNWNRDLMKD